MPVSEQFKNHVLDLLEPMDGLAVKRMFGGAGVFRDGLMFALMIDDRLYFKADEESHADFEAVGAGPFTYERRGKTVALSYFEAPEDVLDDGDEIIIWAGRAWETARRAAKSKPEKKKGGRK